MTTRQRINALLVTMTEKEQREILAWITEYLKILEEKQKVLPDVPLCIK